MTAFPAFADLTAVQGCSQSPNSMETLEMSFTFDSAVHGNEAAERRWFADLLWEAFPRCRSEAELSLRVADVLSGRNRKVTPRTVRNWLQLKNTPHFRYVLVIYTLAIAERLAKAITP